MKTVICDGNNLFSRSCYAADSAPKQMTDDRGNWTGGVVIFANMVGRLIRELSPGRLAVVWDSGSSTYRKALFPEYKAHRQSSTIDGPTFSLAKELLTLIGAHQVWSPGVEADDIISALARRSTSHEVVIVSGDKDFLQLISPKIKVYVPGTPEPMWNQNRFTAFYNIPPEWFSLVLAIAGDVVDGIPGVPRYGVKRAVKALNKARRDMEVLFANDLVLATRRELIERNLALTDLSIEIEGTDVGPIPLFRLTKEGDLAWPALMDFLNRHQMKVLAARFEKGEFGQEQAHEAHPMDRAKFGQLPLLAG